MCDGLREADGVAPGDGLNGGMGNKAGKKNCEIPLQRMRARFIVLAVGVDALVYDIFFSSPFFCPLRGNS